MTLFSTTRQIPASPERVFAALSHPERLARWWGPAGFTNTFKVCEFKQDGRWSFTMHGPDGTGYPNESVFLLIEPAKKVVIRHVNEPQFILTIGLAPSAGGTLVSWEQAFDNAEMAAAIKPLVEPANEQNLDRLAAEVLGRA